MPGGELSILNQARRTLPGPDHLHDLINWSCDSATAIDFWTDSGDVHQISYKLLDELTSALAQHIVEALQAAGACAEDIIVPVLISQSPELYIAWIAILKAGAAFCPITIDTPAERVKFILRDVSASLVLIAVRYERWLAEIAPDIATLAVSQSTLHSGCRVTPSKVEIEVQKTVLRSQSLAYIMYTSGSTGLPKGVKISHKAVCQALLAHDEHIPNFQRFLQFASPTFDVSVFETFFPLFRGATLVGRDREPMLADLPGTMRTMNVDAAELTPTVVGTLLKNRKAAPCLRLLLTIGEMLSKPLIQEFGGSATQKGILYAMYGPTEASVHCTIATEVGVSSSIHNIGKPLATVTAVITEAVESPLSQHGILPMGQTGELAVGGQLASGYLNRPEQTATAFLNLPGYGMFYRTGDRARIMQDGTIEMLGRISSGQVKLRGQRVELGEIESVACRVSGVVMAAASIINDALVLFCVLDGGQTTVANVRELCKDHLMSFMVPRDIILLELYDLPRLSSGKMDRKKIQDKYARVRGARIHQDAVPTDAVTAQICDSISEELGQSISPTTPLRGEGLHSLMAIKITASLRAGNIEVSVRDLLELDTINEIAARLKLRDADADMQAIQSYTLIEDSELWQQVQQMVETTLGACDQVAQVLPCNAIQVAMLNETVSNAKLNFNSIELECRSSVRICDIHFAFQILAQKNEILRSGFVSVDHSSMPFAQIVWEELDLQSDLSLLHPLAITFAEGKTNRFLVQIHHALYDGWSWDLIMADLNALLAASPLPGRPQFRYINRELRRFQSLPQDRAEDYWRRLLESTTLFRLPQLEARLHTGSSHLFERRRLQISTHALAAFASRLHVGSQTVLLAAMSLLLGSYAGSSNVILGLVSSGRHLPVPDIEKVIGPCLSTLPLVLDLSTLRTIKDLLLCVHGLELDMLDYGTMSLHDILATTRSTPHQILFDTLFIWQESLSTVARTKQLVEVVETRDCLDYTLVIEAEPLGHEVVLKMTYDTAKISPQCARNFSAQLDYLIDTIVKDDTISLHDIWNVCDSTVLAHANPQSQLFNRSFELTSTIRRLAEHNPDRLAVSFTHDFDPAMKAAHREDLTYGELWTRSNLMARFLSSHDLGADDIVGVLVEKSIDLYVLDLAVVILGGAFLNIDIRTPSDRIRRILSEVKCKIVITGDREILPSDSDTTGAQSIPLSRLNAEISQYRGDYIHQGEDIRASHLAYAVMTSGTTGVPKAILITRGNLLSNIDILSKSYPLYSDQDVLLQACSPAFDVFVFELFWTWHMGLSLSATTNDILFRDIEAFIRATNVSHLSLTPSVAALIQPDNVPNVKLLVTAGEPMNPRVFNDWAGRGLFQGYGPAETTNICNVKGPVQQDDLINNVGRPLANTSIFICAKQKDDKTGIAIDILPIGAVGEILIGGEQVARGYADHSLTSRSFLDTRYGRLYRSGDMGRLLPTGDLILLGREDDQVKLRGQRIELGDINTAIIGLTFVKDAVTLIIDNTESNARLVSFWKARSEQLPSEPGSRIYEHLEASLPPYMIPDHILPINIMPLTRQGKIDKDKLVQHFNSLTISDLQRLGRGAGRSDEQKDFTEQEKAIAHALSEVVNIPLIEINPDTSFFSLGIDSISSVRFSQKLRQAKLGQIDVSVILKNHSVRMLQRALINRVPISRSTSHTAEIGEVFRPMWLSAVIKMAEAEGQVVEKILPCNPLQESILVSQTNNPSSRTCEARLELNVRGDTHKLRAAWSHLIKRHQILRTGFAITPSSQYAYAQVVLKDYKLPLSTSEDTNCLYSMKSEGYIDPPWCLSIPRVTSGGNRLLSLTMSHALYDAEALALLLEEVELIYKAQELPAVVSPDAYSRYMLSMKAETVDTFWQSRLSHYSPRSLNDVFQTDILVNKLQRTYTYPSKISGKQMQLAAEQSSATASNIFQAAWARLLACYLETEDVVFGNVFSGRNLPIEGVERMVAPLFNTLPLRVRVGGRQSRRALTATIKTAVLETLPFQPSQLRRIVRNQRLDRQPLFDTIILVQSQALGLDEDIWALRSDEGDMEFPGVIIEVIPDGRKDCFVFKLHVQSKKIGSSTAEQVLRNYDVLLDEIVRYPQGQSNDFASINADLPLMNATKMTKTTPSNPRLATEIGGSDEEPLGDLKLSIRKLFAQFSGIPSAEIQNSISIFELGLDSLHVVQIASELRAMGYNITGAAVLESQTIDGLAQACEEAETEKSTNSTSNLDLQAFDQKHRGVVLEQFGLLNKDVQAIRPCTPTQSGILSEFITTKGKIYFNSMLLELSTDIDLGLLRNAWQIVMDRNEMLRTGFVTLNTSEHIYGMITYSEGAQCLPWLIEKDLDNKEQAEIGEPCLQSLHIPCWRLLLKRGTGSRCLEVALLHSLYDANSLDGLLSEVAVIYQNRGFDLPCVTPVAPALCAVLDQSNFSRENSERFWRSTDMGGPPTRFPDLNIRQIMEATTVTVCISSDSLLQEIQGGCRRLGVNMQSACQVAWAQLLATYTGDSKVMFGVVLSGRTLHETSNVMFPTINTVPFSINVGDDLPAMLEAAAKTNIGLFKHQFAPATAVKRWLGIEGELFDTILVLQTTQAAEGATRPWHVVDERAAAGYTISMEVLPQSNGRMELRITTRLDVVPRDHGTILLGQYEALLREVVQEKSRNSVMPVSLQSIVAPQVEHIPTEIRLLHDFVEATSIKIPDAIALEFAYSILDGEVDKQCWSYRQLAEQSNRIAHLLLKHLLEPGEFVAVCFDKCPEASFAILAVLKAGCAYVAIDPAAPIARKRFILDDANCKVLLTTRSLVFSLEEDDKTVMLAVDDQSLLQSQPATAPILERTVQPSDTCYCLYTSGTTGQPKGCLITHASAVQAMLAFQRIFAGHWDKNSRWLQFASFHFDVSVLEQYWSWSVGIRVTSAPRDIIFEDIPGAIHALQITHLDLTPSLARLLKPEQVPSLCRGVFIVGGEQVTQDIIDTWGDVGCLYNFYGPSEVTIGCTVHKRVKKGVKATNIGQPWDNVGAYVLSPGTEIPVLRGAVGELCLSGPLVGKGYLNRPDLTAEKFVMLKKYNIRVYRSGDLVRLLHDNSVEFLGRIDDQVKLRGQRLEIREIDYAIKHVSDSIIDVATMVIKHADQPSEQLVAFFTIRGKATKSTEITASTSPDADDIVSKVRRQLRDNLPMYMIPTQLVPISHIPLSANNKADLKALRAYFAAMPIRSLHDMDWNGASIVPMTATIKRVISSLAMFLGVSDLTISPSSSLFKLGLDSISAVGFASVLRKEGFRSADAATIMRRPLVADLAYELDASEGDEYEQAVDRAKLDIESFRKVHGEKISSLADVESFWPCTPLQEDMLSKTRYGGDTPYYLSAFHYELDRSVTFDVFKHAWTEAQRRFSILRTTFVDLLNKQYAQVVLQHCEAPVHHRHLGNVEGVMGALDRSASEWSQKVSVLGRDPCWQVEVLETSTGQHHFSLRIFHGLYDANSLSLMLKEVANVVKTGAATSAKQNLGFHEALSYGPLCHRAGAEHFWAGKCSSSVLLDLAPMSDRAETTTTTYSVEHALPEFFIATKNKLAVTESAIFQAAFLLSLHSKFGIFPTFGMVVSGRSFPLTGVEGICGPLFNTVPVQILPKEEWSHSDLITACHDFSVGAKAFEHTALREIQQWAGLDTENARFDSLFVFQWENRDVVDIYQDLWTELGQTSTPDYPLNIEVELRKNSFTVTAVSDPDFLDEADLRSISSKFLSAVEMLAARPEELLLPKEGPILANRQVRATEKTVDQGAVDPSVMIQVKSQVALLAQQEVSKLSDDVNLLSLGLDSISFIKLSGTFKKSGLSISVNMIMRLSTPVSIARHLTQRREQSGSVHDNSRDGRNSLVAAQIEIKHALQKQNVSLDRTENVLPVTPMQEGILASFDKYYHFALLKLSADTDLERLRSSWKSVVMLHPILRTSFAAVDDPDIKHVFAQLITVPKVELWEIKTMDSKSHIQPMVEKRSCEILEAGLKYPSFTIDFLVAADTTDRYVLLGMSHAIYDGWSIQLLHRDVASLYQGQQIERPPIEPYLQYILSRPVDAAKAFWTNQMADLLPKPFSVFETAVVVSPTSHTVTSKSRTASSAILRFCMDHSITAQTLGLAICTTVLPTYLQTRDICFGVVLACRDSEDANQLMFPTFNTVPFRPRFNGGSFLDLLKQIQLLSLETAEHEDFPLKEIKKLHAGASGGSAELFDTLFVLQRRTESDQKASTLYEDAELDESPNLEYPVNIEMDLSETLRWTVAASRTVLDEEGVQILIDRLESALEAMLRDPDAAGMESQESQHGPEIPLTQCALSITTHRPEVPFKETDIDLQATVFSTFASVASCNVHSLSGDTNIYSLGLDSISVIKVTSLLRKQNISLPVSKIIALVTLDRIVGEAHRTIKTEISEVPRTSNFVVIPGGIQSFLAAHSIAESAIEIVLPALGGQVFMLDHYRASQGALFYPKFRYKISNASVSEDQIDHAWAEVVQVFSALRTRFIEKDGKIWQVVVRHDAIERYPTATYLTLSQEQGGIVVELQLHHALYDAFSLPIIVSAFEKACQDQSNQPPGSTRTGQASSLEHFINATRSNDTQEARRDFWTTYLKLHTTPARGADTGTFAARRVEAYEENAFSNLDTRAIADRAAREGVSLQALFIAAVARVYATYLRGEPAQPLRDGEMETVILGVYVANRGLDLKELDIETLAAPTVNIVPLVMRFDGGLIECAKRVQEDLVKVQRRENCGISLREVWEWTGQRVRVEWCVNFLPGGMMVEKEDDDGDMYGDSARDGNRDGDGAAVRGISGKVKLTPYPYETRGDVQVLHPSPQNLTSPFLTSPPGEIPWCVTSVDVEARVAKGGGLTVGVFAPEDVFGGNGGEDAVARVASEVRDVLMIEGMEG